MTLHLRKFLCLALCLLLAGCGFKLRGPESVGLPTDAVYLNIGGSGDIGREVEEQLQLTDITLTDTAKAADYIIRIGNHRYDREVLSVSPRTGKVQEYELILRTTLAITTPKGETVLDATELSASRDYTFDETAVIASGDEQQLLREEMTRQLANQALLRMRAAIRNHQAAATAASE